MSGPRTHRVSIPIRFADIDALGHVNNAVFLTYMEVIGTAFWSERIGEVRVQVFVDVATGVPKPVPDSFRERVREFLAAG